MQYERFVKNMKLLHLAFINLLLLCSLPSCRFTIIVKFGNVIAEYWKKAREIPEHNKLYDITYKSPSARKIICNLVKVSRQFVYLSATNPNPRVSNLLMPTPYFNFPKYVTAPVSTGRGKSVKQLEVLRCERSWFMIFGLVDKYMYLLEPVRGEVYIKPTAIIEPSAVFKSAENRQLSEYLLKQLRRDSTWTFNYVPAGMMSVCNLGLNDHIRVCSSAFEILTKQGYFQENYQHINYIPKRNSNQRCQSNMRIRVYPYSKFITADLLPCSINKNTFIPQFYLLTDIQEKASLFVIFQGINDGEMKVRVRLSKVGALLNPSLSQLIKKTKKKYFENQ